MSFLFILASCGGGDGEEPPEAAEPIPVVTALPEETGDVGGFLPDVADPPSVESVSLVGKQIRLKWDSNVWVEGAANDVTLVSDKGVMKMDSDAPLSENAKRQTLSFNIGDVSGDPSEGWVVEFIVITLSNDAKIRKTGADPLETFAPIDTSEKRLTLPPF